MKSIYFKNFAATAAMVLFSFLILGTAFVFLGRSYVISEYRDNMVSNAEEVSHAAQALVRSGELTSWDLRMVISTLAQSTGNHIFITDTDGTVVSCSCRNIACEHLGRTLTGSAMTQLRSDGKFNLITSLGGFYSSAHYVVAQPINIGSAARIVGYVFVTTNSATIIDGWRTFVWVFLAASAAVMMIALLLSLVTSKRMAQPLDEMAVAAKKFAHGDFSARVTDDGRTDEVGALISAFNTMADSLETSEERRNAFIANVSHELKTPLQGIIGSAELIENGMVRPDDLPRFVGHIHTEAARLVTLIDDIIRLSQLDEGGEMPTGPVDLLAVAQEAAETLQDAAAARQVTVSVQGEPTVIPGVRRLLYEIVYNLCDNAIKYNRDGGRVDITVAHDAGGSSVTVADTGIGIAPEHQARVFERFYRVDKSHSKASGGTGLGLSIVKHAVQYHHGRIELESTPGTGTTIRAIFPKA